MARALQLARRGLATAHPNPRVGCVIVREGRIVGEGWHRRTGEPHAEINALEAAGEAAAGAVAYVTLEPCSHRGRTGPCTRALAKAGVAEVIAAIEDPSLHASGRAREELAEAGVGLRFGLLRAAAESLNEGFLSRVRRGRPFLRLKIAASLDGATAMADGTSQWITGDAARADVQRLRAISGAVMTGAGTVLADDPSLTVRTEEAAVQPLRVVVDSRLRMPAGCRMFGLPGRTLVACVDDSGRESLEEAGGIVRRLPAAESGVDLSALLELLADEFEINDLLVEAGRRLSGSLVAGGLVDELVIYQAPHIMGSETRGMFATPGWLELHEGPGLDVVDVRRVGRDLRITARPAPGGKRRNP